jgi:hypothetical protein
VGVKHTAPQNKGINHLPRRHLYYLFLIENLFDSCFGKDQRSAAIIPNGFLLDVGNFLYVAYALPSIGDINEV